MVKLGYQWLVEHDLYGQSLNWLGHVEEKIWILETSWLRNVLERKF